MLTDEQRNRIVTVAGTWIGTRYRGWSAVRGPKGGVDCGMLLKAVFQEAGFIPQGTLGIDMGYSLQVAQHRDDSAYLDKILEYFDEIQEHEARAGDLVVYRLGHAFAHGGIVVDWPLMIHAVAHGGVRYASGYTHPALAGHVKRFFTLRDKEAE